MVPARGPEPLGRSAAGAMVTVAQVIGTLKLMTTVNSDEYAWCLHRAERAPCSNSHHHPVQPTGYYYSLLSTEEETEAQTG